MSNKGDISKIQRIMQSLDSLLALTADETTLTTVNHKAAEALHDNLTKAYLSGAGIAQELGDNSWIVIRPPERKRK